ncbi:MAG: cobalamin-dependent protein [Desulfobacterales bacterium]|nr:cobalamin-dependent protein [Desulfobacterales bacterium]
MKPDKPHILLVNPWITDFAAYDFWAKPLGVLTLAGILRAHDFKVSYLDCLDRFHPNAPASDPGARDGRGPYLKTRIKKPDVFEDVPRNYSRYGIRPEWFRQDLRELAQPDLVLVTSLMTYWYPGVQETIRVIKEIFPEPTVILGGIYATLCREHAVDHSGADLITPGPGEGIILELASRHTGFSAECRFDPEDMNTYPYPAFDLQRRVNYVPLLTSKGCPFKCAYCASHLLHPKSLRRGADAVVAEIQFWHQAHGVRDFVFYDDALLVDAEKHAMPLFEAVIQAGLDIQFHLPNAVHIRGITDLTAGMMVRAGFKTIRLGLETTAFTQREGLDAKVTAAEFVQAVTQLKNAGFKKNQVGAYLLAGLPGQTLASIVESIRTVKQSGITPIPAYYSPIPQTVLWKAALKSSRYPLEKDPIYTNNAVLPCYPGAFSWEAVSYLKNLSSG